MALQLVTPIIAQTMMACTQPFNYTYGAASREEHGKMRIGYTTILPNYEQNNTFIPTEKLQQKHIIQLCKIENLPQQNSDHVVKDFKIRRNNQRNRRFHKIYQPGGADCSQRR